MAIVLKGGAVFLHIPKTGGSWVTRILEEFDLIEGRIGHKHADADRVLNAYRYEGAKAHAAYLIKRKLQRKLGRFLQEAEAHPKPFMFCFVRHPLAWYESWFKYQSLRCNWRTWGNERNPENWHPLAALNQSASDSFNGFVRNVLKTRPGYVTELYGGYTRPGLVDFVGRQENLREDLIRVLVRLGLPHDPEVIRRHSPVNVSTEAEMRLYWEPGLRAEVERLEYAALVRHGYRSAGGVGSGRFAAAAQPEAEYLLRADIDAAPAVGAVG